MKRLIYRMKWNKRLRVWDISAKGFVVLSETRKEKAERKARSFCRWVWETDHQPTQLLIYTKAGRIGKGGRYEASYGCNSKRRDG